MLVDARRILCFVVLALVAAATEATSQPLSVSRIIDGDTFELSDGRRVRLIGIDAPESHPSAKLTRDAGNAGLERDTVRALGILATDHARKMAQDKPVELEFDQANAARDHLDRYGRTVAYVWVLGADGEPEYMVNRRMVAEGYANTYTAYPFVYIDEFHELEIRAREEGRGLWADGALQVLAPGVPVGSRTSPGGNALVASARGNVFHRVSCPHAETIAPHNRIYFADRREAEESGYRACRTCRP